ncbi:MAG: 2-phospho-L-lactate transferase [Acidipila sp.]|nr:2-phospho-L-lactate transferase [Acidipila sp.]
MRVVALAGGVGASKLLWGLARAMDPSELTIIVNTGDDIRMHGLHISPDLDIVTYTLAGAVNTDTGWGISGDTFRALEVLGRYGRPVWFNLGDRDLATHIHRTALLASGATLTQAADSIRRAWGVSAAILPMSNDPVPTIIVTSRGEMHFQEYLVQHRAEPEVLDIHFEGIENARPAPGVLEALDAAEAIIFCPSNPLISLGPILAVAGIREKLWDLRERVVAVSPLVAGRSLKGPSDRMMAQCGCEATSLGVANLYSDIVGTLLIDIADAPLQSAIEAVGIKVVVEPSVMRRDEDKDRLARVVLALFGPRAVAAPAVGQVMSSE